MTFERHRVLSAKFVDAVEQADAERASCIRRLLLFWWPWRSTQRERPSIWRRPQTEPGLDTAVEGQRWCDSTERQLVNELTSEGRRLLSLNAE